MLYPINEGVGIVLVHEDRDALIPALNGGPSAPRLSEQDVPA